MTMWLLRSAGPLQYRAYLVYLVKTLLQTLGHHAQCRLGHAYIVKAPHVVRVKGNMPCFMSAVAICCLCLPILHPIHNLVLVVNPGFFGPRPMIKNEPIDHHHIPSREEEEDMQEVESRRTPTHTWRLIKQHEENIATFEHLIARFEATKADCIQQIAELEQKIEASIQRIDELQRSG